MVSQALKWGAYFAVVQESGTPFMSNSIYYNAIESDYATDEPRYFGAGIGVLMFTGSNCFNLLVSIYKAGASVSGLSARLQSDITSGVPSLNYNANSMMNPDGTTNSSGRGGVFTQAELAGLEAYLSTPQSINEQALAVQAYFSANQSIVNSIDSANMSDEVKAFIIRSVVASPASVAQTMIAPYPNSMESALSQLTANFSSSPWYITALNNLYNDLTTTTIDYSTEPPIDFWGANTGTNPSAKPANTSPSPQIGYSSADSSIPASTTSSLTVADTSTTSVQNTSFILRNGDIVNLSEVGAAHVLNNGFSFIKNKSNQLIARNQVVLPSSAQSVQLQVQANQQISSNVSAKYQDIGVISPIPVGAITIPPANISTTNSGQNARNTVMVKANSTLTMNLTYELARPSNVEPNGYSDCSSFVCFAIQSLYPNLFNNNNAVSTAGIFSFFASISKVIRNGDFSTSWTYATQQPMGNILLLGQDPNFSAGANSHVGIADGNGNLLNCTLYNTYPADGQPVDYNHGGMDSRPITQSVFDLNWSLFTNAAWISLI